MSTTRCPRCCRPVRLELRPRGRVWLLHLHSNRRHECDSPDVPIRTPRHLLTWDDVRAIREQFRAVPRESWFGVRPSPLRTVARRYGVKRQTIYSVIIEQNWPESRAPWNQEVSSRAS